MQVGAALVGEVKIDDHVDGLDVDTSSDEVGADQGLELSLTETVETFDSLIGFHVGVEVFILVFLFV